MERNPVPAKAQTIAFRRAARIAEKIRRAKRFVTIRAWWSDRPIEALGLGFVFLFAFYIVYPFWATASPAVAFSGPVIPVLAKGIAFIGTIPLNFSIQIVNIIFFLAFGFSLYIFTKKVTGRKIAAFLAVFISILPFSIMAKVRAEYAFLGPDGPHIASLALIPLALSGLLAFIREGKIRNLFFASFSSSLVALTSPFGFFNYAIFSAITVFSEMLLGNGRLKLVRFLAVFILAGAFSSFWYNPGFFYWMLTGEYGEGIRDTVSKLIPVSFYTLPILGVFGFLLFDRKPELQPLFLGSFYTIVFAIIVWVGGGFLPSLPNRYLPELGISLSLLTSILILRLFDFMKFGPHFTFLNDKKGFVANGLMIVTFCFLIGGIVFGERIWFGATSQVLGLRADIEKGNVWIARESFSGGASYLGYAISTLAVISLVLINNKSKSS